MWCHILCCIVVYYIVLNSIELWYYIYSITLYHITFYHHILYSIMYIYFQWPRTKKHLMPRDVIFTDTCEAGRFIIAFLSFSLFSLSSPCDGNTILVEVHDFQLHECWMEPDKEKLFWQEMCFWRVNEQLPHLVHFWISDISLTWRSRCWLVLRFRKGNTVLIWKSQGISTRSFYRDVNVVCHSAKVA